MTGAQRLGVLLVVLGLLYALLYVGWLRRSAKRASTEAVPSGAVAPGPAAGQISGTVRPDSAGSSSALVLAWVEGTYVGTTTAVSRHERVAAAKRALRKPATMVVDDRVVRWEGGDTGDLTVAGTSLLGASLERDPAAGSAMGRRRIVRVEWQADNGDHLATTFLPRGRPDSAALVSAVQRLMRIGAPPQETIEIQENIDIQEAVEIQEAIDDAVQDTVEDTIQDTPARTETGLHSRVEAGSTRPDGTP